MEITITSPNGIMDFNVHHIDLPTPLGLPTASINAIAS